MRRSVLSVLTVAIGLGLLLVYAPGRDDLLLIASFCVSFMVLDFVTLRLPRGGVIRMNGGVVVAAATMVSPLGAVGAYLVGAGVASLLSVREEQGRHSLAIRFTLLSVAIWMTSAAYAHVMKDVFINPRDIGEIAIVMGLGLAYMILDLLIYGLTAAKPLDRVFQRTSDLVRILGGSYLAQISVGVVLALVYPTLGVLAFLVLIVLMLVMQHSFGLLLHVRAAYMKTVSAMARLTEMQDADRAGHSERVASISSTIGHRLRMKSAQLERLALASLLHDIGSLRVEPDALAGYEVRTQALERADAGAILLSQVSFLASLAPVVRRHPHAFSEYIDIQDSDGLLSRLVHLASDFDEMVTTSSLADARAFVQAGAGTEYDPTAVQALETCVAAGECDALW